MRSIKEDAALWAEEIMKRNWELPEDRISYAEVVKQASFDVKEQARKMQNFYLTGKL